MNILSSRKRIFLVYNVLLLTVFLITCRKIDYDQEKKQKPKDAAAKFFNIPTNTNPTIRRLAEAMKRYNDGHDYVTDFSKKHGFPKWDKCPKLLVGGDYNKGNGVEYKDTVAFVPITNTWSGPGDAERVASFLAARLTEDSIQIRLFNADEYAAYGMTDRTDTLSAEYIASFSMYLETIAVPGRDSFRLVDDRLFPSFTRNGDSSRVTFFVETLGGGDHDRTGLSIPVETTQCFTYCHNYRCFRSANEPWGLYCYDVCYGFWSFIIQDEPGIILTGGGSGGGTGSLGQQANCSLYPQGVCGQPPILGWIPKSIQHEEFDPYLADSVRVDPQVLDSFPCIYHLIKDSLWNTNMVTQVVWKDVFALNQKSHVYFKVNWNMTCNDSSMMYTNSIGTSSIVNGTNHWTDTIFMNPCFLRRSSKELIIGMLLHESIHTYINWCWNEYHKATPIGSGLIDSTYLKDHFGLHWQWFNQRWQDFFANGNQNSHELIATRYVNDISTIILRFCDPGQPYSLRKFIANNIAAGGLRRTTAWGQAIAASDTCSINKVNYWATRFQNVSNLLHTFYMPCSGTTYHQFLDSLHMQSPDSCQ